MYQNFTFRRSNSSRSHARNFPQCPHFSKQIEGLTLHHQSTVVVFYLLQNSGNLATASSLFTKNGRPDCGGVSFCLTTLMSSALQELSPPAVPESLQSSYSGLGAKSGSGKWVLPLASALAVHLGTVTYYYYCIIVTRD